MRRAAALLVSVLALGLVARAPARAATPCDWRMYGHDLVHSFQQDCTSISTANVATLRPRWVLRTPNSVSASPAVADGVIYDGDWSGDFYAIDAASGKVLWQRLLNDGESVSYGLITASPAVATLAGRNVVVVSSGATVYVLDAGSGATLASRSLDPRGRVDPSQTVEIESSPAVGPNGVIYSGLDFNEGEGVGRAGLVALRFTGSSLQPLWKFDPESGETFTGAGALTFDPDPRTDFGCGDVWTTPAVSGALVFIGVANCQHPDQAQQSGENWSEEMVAVSADDGTPAWSFRPDTSLAAAWADDDFGASPNVFTTARGAQLVGEGQKSAVYWARWRDAGAQAWSQLAGQPGHVTEGSPTSSGLAIGGFIGSTAVQTSGGVAQRIIGATALPVPDPTDPLSVDRSTWAVRALDPATGDILWKDRLAGPAYGAVSVAGGVVFVPDTFTDTLQALDASDGLPLAALPLGGPPSSTPVVAGDAVYVGAGTGEQGPTGSNLLGPASGIWAFGL